MIWILEKNGQNIYWNSYPLLALRIQYHENPKSIILICQYLVVPPKNKKEKRKLHTCMYVQYNVLNETKNQKREENRKERRTTEFEVLSFLIYMGGFVQRDCSSSTSCNVNRSHPSKIAINLYHLNCRNFTEKESLTIFSFLSCYLRMEI